MDHFNLTHFPHHFSFSFFQFLRLNLNGQQIAQKTGLGNGRLQLYLHCQTVKFKTFLLSNIQKIQPPPIQTVWIWQHTNTLLIKQKNRSHKTVRINSHQNNYNFNVERLTVSCPKVNIQIKIPTFMIWLRMGHLNSPYCLDLARRCKFWGTDLNFCSFY